MQGKECTMSSTIFMLKEGASGIKRGATYSLPPKKALICYVEQYVRNNWDTTSYPETLEGMRESSVKKDHWYYDVIKPGRPTLTIAAYPM